ncbi:MAG: N-formylglutamate amidohydrolase [Phenylobacterium zucineum]|nr:MAG: N-formylglutamate amidohydrolase [Phenylobacterium zucineum]
MSAGKTTLDSVEQARGRFHAVWRAGPEGMPPPTPLVLSSPHSGRLYPDDMVTCLSGLDIRRSEDAYVDKFLETAPNHGAALITALAARAYMDVNRRPYELDPEMFAEPLPAFARGHSPQVAAGLGSVARVIAEGLNIYAHKLTFTEAQTRIDRVHVPYHNALKDLIDQARAAHGFAILIDWHSMPATAARGAIASGPCDIILGDRYGASCHPALIERVEVALSAWGYRVARNNPYAGGYTTELYGRPQAHVHALQIEINRGLYLDESCLKLTSGFHRLRADIARLSQDLATEVWDGLRPEGLNP